MVRLSCSLIWREMRRRIDCRVEGAVSMKQHRIYKVNLDKAEPENELVASFPLECEREYQLTLQSLQFVQGSQSERNKYYAPYAYHGETK